MDAVHRARDDDGVDTLEARGVVALLHVPAGGPDRDALMGRLAKIVSVSAGQEPALEDLGKVAVGLDDIWGHLLALEDGDLQDPSRGRFVMMMMMISRCPSHVSTLNVTVHESLKRHVELDVPNHAVSNKLGGQGCHLSSRAQLSRVICDEILVLLGEAGVGCRVVPREAGAPPASRKGDSRPFFT